jgi:Zn-dependent membrane protease YugP
MKLVSIIVFLLSLLVQQILRRRMATYARVTLKSGLTGAEIARKMLSYHGLQDMKIICSSGELTDHYNPLTKTVNLSEAVYYGSNAGSAAVAAHECGHAVQHAEGYAFLRLRTAMVPLASFTARYLTWIILVGFLMINSSLLPLKVGIGLFACTTIFSFITLPVEFDASRRALAWIDRQGIIGSREYTFSKEALWWAAMTYVLAALGSFAELLHLIGILNRRRDE